MHSRLKSIRKHFKLNQKEMGDKIKLSQTHISSLENGAREITDRIISDIRREFNVNENWLRSGKGEMFIKTETFSLDTYAQQKNLTELELNIIKSYMDLDVNVRNALLSAAKQLFGKEDVATSVEEPTPEEIAEKIAAEDAENYRLERLAELKGATLLASQEREETS